MSDKKPKTIEERLVDIILPLFVWAGRKAFGSLFTSIEWHQIATSLVPPPDYLRSNIIRGYKARGIYEDYATESLEAKCSRWLRTCCQAFSPPVWIEQWHCYLQIEQQLAIMYHQPCSSASFLATSNIIFIGGSLLVNNRKEAAMT
jgi:hypothetical protein